jgi:hypothetical protein
MLLRYQKTWETIDFFLYTWQISFECIVLDNINTEEYDVDEGGMFVSNIHLQGAAWDYENDCLKDSV